MERTSSSQLRVLYDGDCPLCSREIRFLENRDGGGGRSCDAACDADRSRQRTRSMRRRGLHVLGQLLLVALAGCQTPSLPLHVVDDVDLDRYLGRWYEVASFPQHFQKGCVASTAHYTRREDGRIRVVNECRDGSFDGELRRAEGVAWVVDPDASTAKLKVQFFWPFRGDYWVIELDPEYRYAVVGHPSRDYLWILSRTPQLDPDTYAQILSRIAAHGYDTSRLERTPQPDAPVQQIR